MRSPIAARELDGNDPAVADLLLELFQITTTHDQRLQPVPDLHMLRG